ncbi:MAG: hypothetical protein ACI4IG_05280 [Eubacterium sp.]
MGCSYRDLRNIETTVHSADKDKRCRRDDCDVVIAIFDSDVNFCCRRRHHDCDSAAFEAEEEQTEE